MQSVPFVKGTQLSIMLVLSTNGHDGQYDKAGKPYILHPLAVMHKLRTEDEELQAIAIGHDLIEDGKIKNYKGTGAVAKVTYGMLIELGVTQRVIAGIRALTRVPGESEDEYQEKVMGNVDAMQVKRRDLEHNSDLRRLKGMEEKDIVRMVKYAKFYLRICAALQVEAYKA